MLQHFVNDESGYLAWISRHPLGFVLNTTKNPKQRYLILHAASCRSISTTKRSNYTTRQYVKHCAEERHELEAWARDATGGTVTDCALCKP
jgi:hypothetical protein